MPMLTRMGRPALDYAYFDAGFLALAHRGGTTDDAPAEVENSMRGFLAAWEYGFRYLETDVHVTSDGVLVAFHDEVLDRVTDASGALADLPWAEVAQARIGGTEPIPRLDDLLAGLPDARFNIDLKADGAVEPLVDALDRHAAHDRVCVGSFSGRRIGRFRRLTSGRVATAASPVEVAVFALLPGIRRLWPLRGQAFQIPQRHYGLPIASAGLIETAHRRGAVVHVWTINDRPTMERLIDCGVDGLVSDDLGELRTVLRDRDLWEGP